MDTGVIFDHYEVLTRTDGSLHELGRGAMGITYKAFDTNLRVPVALKVINTQTLDSESARDQFMQEARSAARLRHQHVASVFHLGTEGDTVFYAMEFIDGETVESLVKRRGPLPALIVFRMALQVARALGAAQQHGLVHRDIKPANIMLIRADEELCAKVIDFGLAKVAEEAESSSAEANGTHGFVGTPHYASPEQLEVKPLDVRSDIYALGATMWFMLTGHPPFTGTMQQVMQQHLTAPLPLDKLRGVPGPLATLLLRLLAKKPEERPATAAELRREIEAAIEAAARDHAEAFGMAAAEERAIAEETAKREAESPVSSFATRNVMAGHLEVQERLGETNDGWLFRARDLERERVVRLLVLRRDFSEHRALFTRLEEEVLKVCQVQHPNVLHVHGLEMLERSAVIVLEWTQGVTLREVLRARGELSAGEVLLLLQQMAAGVDHAMEAGLKRLDLALHQVFLHFPAPVDSAEALLATPLTHWPEFIVKLNPLDLAQALTPSPSWAGEQTMGSGATLAGGMTVVAGMTVVSNMTIVRGMSPMANDGAEGGLSTAYARAVAMLVYELLGGTAKAAVTAAAGGGRAGRYTPLAKLSEAGNQVLRTALNPAQAYPSATELLQRLRAVDQLEIRPAEMPALAGASVARAAASTAVTMAETAPYIPPAPPPRRGLPPLAWAAGIVALIGAAAFVMLRPKPQPPEIAPAPPAATPAPTLTQTPVEQIIVPTPVPEPAKPDRGELLKQAVEKAEATERRGDLAEAIPAWVEIAKTYPEAEVGRQRLNLLLDDLEARGEKPPRTELLRITPQLREAAKMGAVSAMMLLGDALREKDPVESFEWVKKAADKKVAAALRQLGYWHSNGIGTPRSLEEAVRCLTEATERGDSEAQGALGECYLLGKGVEKDLPKAIQLLRGAASRNDVRALNRLGTCFQLGTGVEKDFDEAFRLFTQAANRGFLEATGNLGVLYINGEGVKRNPRKAVELFKQGAERGSGYCMFLLARCFESGTGTNADAGNARSWYRRAAEAGVKPAVDWCKKNGVEFTPRETAA